MTDGKWKWKEELTRARLSQADVGIFLNLSESQMSHLVSKMVRGKGLTATAQDQERWKRALDYIHFSQSKQLKEPAIKS